MKITALARGNTATTTTGTRVRDTAAQDTAVPSQMRALRSRHRLVAGGLAVGASAGCALWLTHILSQPAMAIAAERLQLATVTRGRLVRDVAAQGTVVAAVSPTLFAVAGGTVSYHVHAGDTVRKGQILAELDSPELTNEYQREKATLQAQDSALARQEIEERRELLTSRQQADLAQVSIEAAQREMKRAQWAWDLRAIPERDYRKQVDEVTTAKLNLEHAQATAGLEKESLALELATRREERARQGLVVENLARRVGELTVRSPVDGMVGELAQTDRTKVTEGAALLTVVDLSALELEFHVAETYAGDIRPGMAAEITLGGRMEPGIVTAISPEVRQSEVTGRLRFARAQPAGLRQNERAAVRIVLDERGQVTKLARGVALDEGTHALYVVRGAHAMRVPVELGAASITEIEVKGGLSPGDQVVISDTRDFHDSPAVVISH
jgi:HlyD family secretion protein